MNRIIKKILLGVALISGLILLSSIGLVIYAKIVNSKDSAPKESKVLKLINDNPEKCALKLVRNDTIIAELNPQKPMSLASTMKVIIAIEYACQASNGMLNPDEEVGLLDLNRYYVARSDGGAHPAWLKSIREETQNDSISIREIASGMIRYSSNANTEWLCDKLGLVNINNQLNKLGVKSHEDIFYPVSSLFIGDEEFPDLQDEELETAVTEMSQEEYRESANRIHSKMKADTNYIKRERNKEIRMQKIRSNKLPKSTVEDYVKIMKKINSRTHFTPSEQAYLDEIMEYLLKNPANKKWLKHAGKKGGSTAIVLTSAIYATDLKGNTTELAYFFEDLSQREMRRLKLNKNQFELKILTNQKFRDTIGYTLNIVTVE